jgi:hypothetical protein
MPNQFLSPEGDLEDYFVDEYWLIDQYVGDTLWTWGQNGYGQLGINSFGTATLRSTPNTTFGGGSNWKQVACGYHTAAIKIDGTLWTWGRNSYGQLGINNTTSPICTPVQEFYGGTNWKQVACGWNHTAAIKTDGTLWCWGWNAYGQLGLNNTSSPIRYPVQEFLGGTNWKQVVCGFGYTTAIKTDGTLWSWGNNVYGQLGDNTKTQRVTPIQEFTLGTSWKQIACGFYHTVAIKSDGTLWSWGLSSDGQLGYNSSNQKCTPVQEFYGGTNWKQVAGGQYHTAAIKTDGTLWCWGKNDDGQLGDNTQVQKNTPVQTFLGGSNWKQVAGGFYHTVAIRTNGTLWGWGRNTSGELGLNNTTSPISSPTQIYGAATNWKQVSGAFHTAAVTSGTDPTHFIS